MKKFGLMLSGGGARSLAEIGVLKTLERHNLIPDVITGTSMGRMIGGFYVAGLKLSQMEKFAMTVIVSKILDAKSPLIYFLQNKLKKAGPAKYRGMGASLSVLTRQRALDSGRKIEYFLNKVTEGKDFSELRIPFACVATDLLSGKKIVLNEGKLSSAIRATISLPLIFEPFEYNRMLLVDGGVTNNAPIDVAREMGAEVVVAIDVNEDIKKRDEESFKTSFDVSWRATGITQSYIYRMELKSGDLIIKTGLGLDTMDFSKAKECIMKGEEDMEKEIKKLKGLLEG